MQNDRKKSFIEQFIFFFFEPTIDVVTRQRHDFISFPIFILNKQNHMI